MRALKFALLASLAIATPTLAADLSPQSAQPEAYNWSGIYVGAQAGYVWGNSTYDGAGSPAGPPFNSTSVNPKGGFGGAFVGYNYQFDGNYVVGVEADVNFADAKSDHGVFVGAIPLPPSIFASSDLKWFGSSRLCGLRIRSVLAICNWRYRIRQILCRGQFWGRLYERDQRHQGRLDDRRRT